MDSSSYLSDRRPMKNPSPAYSGIKKEAYELLCPIHCDPPHLLCLTERHFHNSNLINYNKISLEFLNLWFRNI
jgi:hypothetical protein